ncbi:MAG: KilA-N domain-containing protein [Candidatus Delongbacteria bacterium]
MKKVKLSVQGKEISLINIGQEDYISLTDMVKGFGDDVMIYSWMRNRNTLEYLRIFR